jgi:hypothetical protein
MIVFGAISQRVSGESKRNRAFKGLTFYSLLFPPCKGSLMPTMVMKLIFGMVPGQAPFFIRPIASAICNGVMTSFVDPDINSKISYIASEMEKKQGEFKWFAGGDKDGNPVSSRGFKELSIKLSFVTDRASSLTPPPLQSPFQDSRRLPDAISIGSCYEWSSQQAATLH